MDTELREDLERCLGDGPPLAHADLVARGRRALVRRRLAQGASALTLGAVAVTALVLTVDQAPPGQTPVVPATSTATPTTADGHSSFVTVTDPTLPEDQPVALALPNEVHQLAGVKLRWVAMDTQPEHAFSLAIAYEFEGRTWWYRGYLDSDGTGAGGSQRPEPGVDFRDWANPPAKTVP